MDITKEEITRRLIQRVKCCEKASVGVVSLLRVSGKRKDLWLAVYYVHCSSLNDWEEGRHIAIANEREAVTSNNDDVVPNGGDNTLAKSRDIATSGAKISKVTIHCHTLQIVMREADGGEIHKTVKLSPTEFIKLFNPTPMAFIKVYPKLSLDQIRDL